MRKIDEKDMNERQKKAANCTLTYLSDGVYSDLGIQKLWDCYLKRCEN